MKSDYSIDNFIHHEQDSRTKIDSNMIEDVRYINRNIKNINFLHCNKTVNTLADRMTIKSHVTSCSEM